MLCESVWTLSNQWLSLLIAITADVHSFSCLKIVANFLLNSCFLTVLRINWKLLISFLELSNDVTGLLLTVFWGVTWVPTGLKLYHKMDP